MAHKLFCQISKMFPYQTIINSLSLRRFSLHLHYLILRLDISLYHLTYQLFVILYFYSIWKIVSFYKIVNIFQIIRIFIYELFFQKFKKSRYRTLFLRFLYIFNKILLVLIIKSENNWKFLKCLYLSILKKIGFFLFDVAPSPYPVRLCIFTFKIKGLVAPNITYLIPFLSYSSYILLYS